MGELPEPKDKEMAEAARKYVEALGELRVPIVDAFNDQIRTIAGHQSAEYYNGFIKGLDFISDLIEQKQWITPKESRSESSEEQG